MITLTSNFKVVGHPASFPAIGFLERHAARWLPHIFWLLGLAAMVVAVFGRLLFYTTDVVSGRTTDLSFQFFYTRGFAAAELMGGNFPLWNPYAYGGVPFFADFQSALLYPLNAIFLVLPLTMALNWSFAIHVFLLGAGVYAWGIHRNFHPAGAFLAGAVAMFSGPFFLHVYAGHLSNLCSMAWAPFIFLGIDGWLRARKPNWVAFAAVAVALQIYAGHPQYVYYTAVVAGLYSIVYLIKQPNIGRAALGLAAIYVLGAMLAAAQLLPGIAAAGESVRSGGTPYDFAATFSLPPENFATSVLPWVMGNMQTVPYWGQCYLWEMNLFVGAGTLLLAVFGFVRATDRAERVRMLALLLVVTVLALGWHTPIHRILYDVLPGFGSFRGASKFAFFLPLFVALLAGAGFTELLARRKVPLLTAIGAMVGGAAFIAAGFFVGSHETLVRDAIDSVSSLKESYLNRRIFDTVLELMKAARDLAAGSFFECGAVMIAAGILFPICARWKTACYFLLALIVGELFFFARGATVSFPAGDLSYSGVADYLKDKDPDHRILNLFNPDSSMLFRTEGIWGYEPSVLKRYSQLLYLSQGAEPKEAGQSLPFSRSHPILRLLRCATVFRPGADGKIKIIPLKDPAPRFYLASEYRVITDEEEMWSELYSLPDADPKNVVFLESEPNPKPEKETAHYEINVVGFTTDQWTLDIRTDKAALLVVTDAYSKDWKVTALPDSDQTHYDMLPAFHALRAIPLAAGHHLLKMEYIPAGLAEGVRISLITMAVLGFCIFFPNTRNRVLAQLSEIFFRHEPRKGTETRRIAENVAGLP